jgi:hypothetical protein
MTEGCGFTETRPAGSCGRARMAFSRPDVKQVSPAGANRGNSVDYSGKRRAEPDATFRHSCDLGLASGGSGMQSIEDRRGSSERARVHSGT